MSTIGPLIGPDLRELIQEKQWNVLREVLSDFDPADIAEILQTVPDQDDVAIFRVLPRDLSGRVFAYLPLDHQEVLLHALTNDQTRTVLQGMSPDDQARLMEELPAEVTRRILEVLSTDELRAARDLLGYPPNTAGRYMTPRYVALRPDMTARESLEHVRRVGRGQETLSIVYIVDATGKLLEELRLGSLVLADPDRKVASIDRPLIYITAATDREEVLRQFKKYDRAALPVTDQNGHMLGIITVDDVLDVAEQQATEDIQKLGGMEALDEPYLEVSYFNMIWKRGGWLSALFLGEMLTATAMGFFEKEIERAVVLALFVPLIISSGGNSGSQASTLIVRALALAEVRLRDWWRVAGRELRSGLSLGTWLGFVGFLRIWLWQVLGLQDYGEHYFLVALTVWGSLIGIVTFGSLAGSMLPFILRKLGFDPAVSSAPFVATLVDVTGLIIYFSVAMIILGGTLLAPPTVSTMKEPLPAATSEEVMGLLSYLKSHNGGDDAYHIAAEKQSGFRQTWEVIEAAQLLELVEVKKHDVSLDQLGKDLLAAEGDKRKELWREQMLRLKLFKAVDEALHAEQSHELPLDSVRTLIASDLSRENQEQILATFVDWSNQAKLFDCEVDSNRIALPRR